MKTLRAVFEEIRSDTEGLDELEAERRLAEVGPNELEQQGGRKPVAILIEQFTATMVLILMAAGILSFILGDTLEGFAIFAIVVLFGVMGFIQEYRAEKSLAALKRMSIPLVRVRRSGAVRNLSSSHLVPGDIVILEAGNIIPADCRVSESWSCKVQESALTGEADAVEKQNAPLAKSDVPLGDRTNMLYRGTVMTAGRAEGIVVATGMRTELGKIASLIQEADEARSPLQKRLENLGKTLAAVGVALSALIVILGSAFSGHTVWEMLIVGVSLAVAIIPEGLPAVLTITLALGAARMFKRHALIRKLPAVETLGSVTVICSDKTGTLTQNRMTAVDVVTRESHWRIDESANSEALRSSLFIHALSIGVLCNDSKPGVAEGHGVIAAVGDPTETCLFDLMRKQGMDPFAMSSRAPRVAELAFDSDRKRMSTLHDLYGVGENEAVPGAAALYGAQERSHSAFMAVKGSPDGLLAVSNRIATEEGIRAMTDKDRKELSDANAALAGQGKRVLGLAGKLVERKNDARGENAPIDASDESELVFVALIGIIDPPRPEVREAIALCKTAGIRPVMITGDHPLTAKAIAKDLGIDHSDEAATGSQLALMEDSELEATVREVSVFARVSPEHKLRIVRALQVQHNVVAMTGDGVNDAPSLRQADIGIAMGITGTDVSREASQMVLTDDNFASIVSAVEEGRVIYDNVRKYLKFSLGGNAGKVIVLLALPFITAALAFSGAVTTAASPVVIGLSALQLLWLNLLCDGLLSIGLGVEHGEKGVMNRMPVHPKATLFDKDMTMYIVINGLTIGVLALAAGLWQWSTAEEGARGLAEVQTSIFMMLFFVQMWSVVSVRTGVNPVFGSGMKQNRIIWLMIVISLTLQMASMYVPFLRNFLGLSALPVSQVAVMFAAAALMIPVLEIQKAVHRRFP